MSCANCCQTGLFPPKDILDNISPESSKEVGSIIVDNGSIAFTITGCHSGSSWTCTLMGARLSQYIEEQEVRDEFQLILQVFGYDPASARRLVTTTIIGMMLEQVAAAYEEVLGALDRTLNQFKVRPYS